jgi:hypothetical protein
MCNSFTVLLDVGIYILAKNSVIRETQSKDAISMRCKEANGQTLHDQLQVRNWWLCVLIPG